METSAAGKHAGATMAHDFVGMGSSRTGPLRGIVLVNTQRPGGVCGRGLTVGGFGVNGVIVGVGFSGFGGVVCSVMKVAVCNLSVMRGEVMIAFFVVTRGFTMMTGCVVMVFGCFMVMFGC